MSKLFYALKRKGEGETYLKLKPSEPGGVFLLDANSSLKDCVKFHCCEMVREMKRTIYSVWDLETEVVLVYQHTIERIEWKEGADCEQYYAIRNTYTKKFCHFNGNNFFLMWYKSELNEATKFFVEEFAKAAIDFISIGLKESVEVVPIINSKYTEYQWSLEE